MKKNNKKVICPVFLICFRSINNKGKDTECKHSKPHYWIADECPQNCTPKGPPYYVDDVGGEPCTCIKI